MSEVVAPILGLKSSIVIDFQDVDGALECVLYTVSRPPRDVPGFVTFSHWHETNRWRLVEARHFAGELEDVLAGVGRAVTAATVFQLALPLSAAGGTVPATDEP